MNCNNFFRLDSVSLVDVVGNDATKIVHNLTTNDVTKLDVGGGCESFITDVRGKTLGHVVVFRDEDRLRMIGAGGQSESVAGHVDRYTIREDSTPIRRDDEFQAFVLPPNVAETHFGTVANAPLTATNFDGVSGEVKAYRVPWLGDGTIVLLAPNDQADAVVAWLTAQAIEACDEKEFHQQRVLVGFPWYGMDVDATNLPQEANRDEAAISFTKGCYLGQETVARLDALGQVQKKLVRWSVAGGVPEPGTTLESGEKKVGRLTSIAAGGDEDAIAIGYARRSHFDPESTAQGSGTAGETFTGRVLASDPS